MPERGRSFSIELATLFEPGAVARNSAGEKEMQKDE